MNASSDAESPPLSPVAARLWARARREWEQQQFAAAEQSLANVVALAPDAMDAVRLLGIAAQRRGDHARTIECFRRVLAAAPQDAGLCVDLGIALYENGEFNDAIVQLRRACALAPASSAAWFNLGKALEKETRAEEAIEAFARTLERDVTHLQARLSLARTQASLGRIDAAVAGFRAVLAGDADNAEAWFGLSALNTVRFDAADAARLQRAFEGAAAREDDRELLGSAFAKALEDQGDHVRAFDVFGAVKRSQRQRVQGSAAGERARVDTIARTFADAPIPAPVAAQQGREVILIVSLPRSGSSLVEQILASHPEVEGANEINDLRDVIGAESLRRSAPFPAWVPTATAEDWHRLGNTYLERTARWRQVRPRFTDKNLLNWYLIGAAARMLPAARVAIVRRDPLETCVACYRQYFTGAGGFACDLDDMADYCANFLRLTQLWQQQWPDRVFELRYESLLADPEAVIRRLLDFCGLSFDPACLAFHQTPRAVHSTPSAAQVREPLRRDTARSALYGHKLDGLRRRLRELGITAD